MPHCRPRPRPGAGVRVGGSDIGQRGGPLHGCAARRTGPRLRARWPPSGPATADAPAPDRRGARPGAGRAQRTRAGRGVPRRGERPARDGSCSRVPTWLPTPFPTGSAAKGWDVQRVEAYRTVARAAPEPALLDRVAAADALTLTATSAVQAFLALRTTEAGRCRCRRARGLHRADDGGRGPGGRARQRARGLGRVGRGHRRRADRGTGPGARLTARRLGRWPTRPLRPRRAGSPCAGCAGCGAPRRCGGWWPRPASGSTTWSPRSSCGRGSPSRSRSRPCRASAAHRRLAGGRGQAPGLARRPRADPLRRPERKDAQGSGAWDPDGVVQVALRAVRDAVGDEIVLMADLCLDEYTDHGHCGILGPDGRSTTTPPSSSTRRSPLAQAEAGADVVAPSGMMDGQVAAIRAALDGGGHDQVGHPGLRGQVRLRPLRPLPGRRRRDDRRRRRPAGLPAGSAQRPGGAGRGGAGRGRGGRHRHGQAGPDLPRRPGRRARGRPRARWPPTTCAGSTPW